MGKKHKKAPARTAHKKREASPAAASSSKGSTSWQGVQGLQNLGNTCFLNSILQCLNASTYFSNQLIEVSEDGLQGLAMAVCQAFNGVRGKKGAFSPRTLLQLLRQSFPWYQGGRQQDAHELLRCLLGAVSDAKITSEKKDDKKFEPGQPHTRCEKVVWDSFRGHLCALVLCWECRHVSLRLDPFLDLSLEIPGTQTDALLLADKLGVCSDAIPDSEEQPERQEDKKAGMCSTSSNNSDTEELPSSAAEGVVRSLMGNVMQKVRAVAVAQDFTRKLVQLTIDTLKIGGGSSGSTADPQEFQIILTRESKKGWGFQWDEDMIAEGELQVSGITEDSIVDKANLKAKASGRENEVVSAGDYVVEIKGKTELKQMRKILKSEDSVTLTIRKGQPGQSQTSDFFKPKAKPQGNSKAGECKSDAEKTKERQKHLQALRAAASKCKSSLPPELEAVFGGLEPTREKESSKGVQKEVALEECLKHFIGTETLEDQCAPQYRCSECEKCGGDKTKTYASRRMLLWPALPPLLTVQLKRFRRQGMKFEKAPVEFQLPATLDLSDFIIKERDLEALKPHFAADVASVDLPAVEPNAAKYELYGICVHQGPTMESGHYVAFINAGPSLERSKWYGASDARVWESTLEKVLKEQAYVAFYRREGLAGADEAADEPEAEEQASKTQPTSGDEADEEKDAKTQPASGDEADEEQAVSDKDESPSEA